MPKPTTLLVRLDVHRHFITFARAEAHRSDPPVFVKSIGSQQVDTDRPIRELHNKAARLVFACEVGPSRPIASDHRRNSRLFASSELSVSATRNS